MQTLVLLFVVVLSVVNTSAAQKYMSATLFEFDALSNTDVNITPDNELNDDYALT